MSTHNACFLVRAFILSYRIIIYYRLYNYVGEKVFSMLDGTAVWICSEDIFMVDTLLQLNSQTPNQTT